MRVRSILLVLAGLVPAASVGAQVFEERSEELGVAYQHVDGFSTFLMAGGVAWLDVDGDGDDDLLCTHGLGAPRLFLNQGGTFADGTEDWGLQAPLLPNTFGVAVGDYDDDGQPDVLFTNNGPNQLLRNAGGTFSDVTIGSGLTSSWMSTSAAWADFDLDGDLDLYVGNYIEELDFPYHQGAPNELFVNDGSGSAPLFVDQAVALGVDDSGVYGPPVPGFEDGAKPGEPTSGCTLSVSTLDQDDDGDPDILVGNDFGIFVLPNRVYRNATSTRGGDLAFTDVSEATGLSEFPQYNMGINPSDVDQDGDWDLYLSDLGNNLLLLNEDGVYRDVTAEAGPVEGMNADGSLLRTSWATLFADVDNDGWEDLYVVNGFVPAAAFIMNEQRSPNGLWRHRGAEARFGFLAVPAEVSGVADEGIGRGASFSDVDGDGLLDIHLMNNEGGSFADPDDACRLFVNTGRLAAPASHWLQLRLAGVLSNSEGLGARIDATVGGRLLRRQVRADPVYLSSPSRLQHFGLGAEAHAQRIVVRWPSGVRQELHDVEGDVRMRVEEPVVVFAGAPTVAVGARGVHVRARIRNADAVPHEAELRVRLAAGSVPFVDVLTTAAVAPGAITSIDVPLSLPAAVITRLQDASLPLELRADLTAESSDALDTRVVPFEF